MTHFPPFSSSIFIDLHKIGRVKKVACKEMFIIEMPPPNYRDMIYNEIWWAFSWMVAPVLGGTEKDALTYYFDSSPTETMNVQK